MDKSVEFIDNKAKKKVPLRSHLSGTFFQDFDLLSN